MNKLLVILTFSMFISACTPTISTRGNLVSDTRLDKVEPLITSADEVKAVWGPPTVEAPFDERTWYYIGQQTETMGIFKNEVIERRVVAVKFDEYDTVIEVKELDEEKIRQVSIDSDRTDTAGKEFTFLQQLVGNLGRFNKAGAASATSAGNN